ncbi:MAG: DUF2252 family protein [Deltaproteobacteria bacterium]
MKSVIKNESVFAQIVAFNADREPDLVKRKLTRLNESVFSFFRGTDHLFGKAWPALQPEDPGPPILCCGDLHAENFGAFQTEGGDFRFDINDFDEALVAPCSFDLVRCTASILLAAEEWWLSPLDATGIALAFLDHYRSAVVEAVKSGRLREISPRSGDGPVWDLLNKTALAPRAKLLNFETKPGKCCMRRIIRSRRKHPPISDRVAEQVRRAVEAFGAGSKNPDAYQVLDVTGRIAGIGSLGLRRYTVLIEGGGSPDKNRMLDVKEARRSSVRPFVDCPQTEKFATEAHRIVAAQRRLQSKPMIGLAPLEIGRRAFRMRELVSDESRSSIDRLQKKPKKLRLAMEVVGQVTGWSQLRGTGAEGREALARWVQGPAIDAVLAAAVRFADQTRRDYHDYHKAYGC